MGSSLTSTASAKREWRRHKPALTLLESLLKAAIFQLLEELSLHSLRWQIAKLLQGWSQAALNRALFAVRIRVHCSPLV